jgi:lysophospholipase L1-like esterase
LPYAAIAASTQNPERAGTLSTTEGIKAHTIRNSQLFSWAARHGYAVVDGYGAFVNAELPLSQLVNADGIHPEPVGSQTWASAAISSLRRRA